MVAKISEGAEALIYSAKFLGFDAVIKVRVAKAYRVKALDQRIRLERVKREARAMSLASSAGVPAPNVLLIDGYRLYMTRISGRNLNKMLKNSGMESAFYRLGGYAAKLHNAGIAHGDYTPANVMIDGKGKPWVIDFGLSEPTNSIEEKALDILLMKRSASAMQFRAFVRGYAKLSKGHAGVMGRLAAIEKRGRYNVRTLMADRVDLPYG